jgi:hypothetical protein
MTSFGRSRGCAVSRACPEAKSTRSWRRSRLIHACCKSWGDSRATTPDAEVSLYLPIAGLRAGVVSTTGQPRNCHPTGKETVTAGVENERRHASQRRHALTRRSPCPGIAPSSVRRGPRTCSSPAPREERCCLEHYWEQAALLPHFEQLQVARALEAIEPARMPGTGHRCEPKWRFSRSAR